MRRRPSTLAPALAEAVPAAARWVVAHPEGAGWLVTAPLAALAGARALGVERHPALAVANAATHFLYLPAWLGLAIGLRRRRPALAAVSAVVAGAHAAWAGPELRRPPPVPSETLVAPRFRVYSANIQFAAADWEQVAGQVAASAADVVVLQELTPTALAVVRRSGALAGYEHAFVDARPRSFGGGIWSRWPLCDTRSCDVAGLPMTRAAVELDGGRVQIVNVHTRSPLAGGLARWHAQLAALADMVAAERGPLVLAGDFNATFGNPGFRRLLRQGLGDAHVLAGRGLAPSWPCGWLLPPLFRLDHVLVSDGLVVLDAGVGDCAESDHRAVWADLALVGGGPPA